MTDLPVAEPLSQTDLAMIRKADRIVFHHKQNGKVGYGEAAGVLTAIVEAKDGTTGEFRREIPVRSGVTDYGQTCHALGTQDCEVVCFEMIHTPGFSPEWQTIAGLMKAGDTVSLEWISGGSQWTNERGIQRDTLRLEIARPFVASQKNRKRYSFTVAVSICDRYSTARMIRVHRAPAVDVSEPAVEVEA